MAQRRRPKRPGKQAQTKRDRQQGSFVFGQRNVLLMVAGVVIIVLGYFLLGRGSITAAPLLLVAGYCVIVPLAIVLWIERPEDKKQIGSGE